MHAREVLSYRLTPISRVSNFRFDRSYATSSVSAAIFVSARHASEEDPMSITILIILAYFSSHILSQVQHAGFLMPLQKIQSQVLSRND